MEGPPPPLGEALFPFQDFSLPFSFLLFSFLAFGGYGFGCKFWVRCVRNSCRQISSCCLLLLPWATKSVHKSFLKFHPCLARVALCVFSARFCLLFLLIIAANRRVQVRESGTLVCREKGRSFCFSLSFGFLLGPPAGISKGPDSTLLYY